MLSDNIRTVRKNRGFTQEELAARLHITRQTVSKWEKGYSVPDAELLSRMAEVLEVPVTELLGAPSQPVSDPEPIVEQLSRLNEQLAVKNRRASRIWKIAGITLAAILVLWIGLAALGAANFAAGPRAAAGAVTWQCTLDGQTYECGVEYTKDLRIVSGHSAGEAALADQVPDVSLYGDAKRAQSELYDWFESRGGTVEVVSQTGVPLPERVS